MQSVRNPGALSSKALKTMGLSVEDLFESFVGSKSGELPRNEYSIFWHSLMYADQHRDIGLIVRLLVRKITEVLDDATHMSCPVHSLVNTLYFVIMFLPWKVSTLLEKSVKSLEARTDKLPESLLRCGAYEVIRTIYTRVCEKKDAMDFLISQAHSMHSPETFKLLAEGNSIATLDRVQLASRSFGAVPLFIMEQCKESYDIRIRVLNIVIAQLKALHNECSFQNGAEDSLLALLHLIRSLLSTWRVHDIPLLKNAIEAVSPFFLWPMPYALVARRVMLMLRHEILAPGNSILERFAAESRVPETTITTAENHSRSRPVFYVIDGACAESSNWMFILNLFDADEFMNGDDKIFASGLSTEVQALLLLNILADDQQMDPQEIYSITEDGVAMLFGETVNILQEALDMPEEGAKEHRQRNFVMLRAQLSKMAKTNQAEAIQSDLKLPSILPEELLPDLPEISHVHWIVNRDYHFPSIELITQLGYTPYPKTPVSARLERIIRLYEAFADPNDPVEVRICIAGGDSIIHQVSTAFVDIISRSPELLHGMMLRFFVVPFRNSLLAAYIARHDSWYYRHVYEPIRSERYLIPSMRVDGPVLDPPGDIDEMLPTGKILRNNIESYLREAECTMQTKLFKIEGWKSANSSQSSLPDLVVPLVERAEIGRVANAMLFKNMGKDGTMGSVLDLQDVFKDKDFNYVPLEMNVQLTFVDLRGEECERLYERRSRKQQQGAPGGTTNGEQTVLESTFSTTNVLLDDDYDDADAEEPIPFDRIVLANFPSAEDPTFPANPRDPWLELYAKVAEGKTKIKNRYSFLMQEPQQHISKMSLISARDDQLFRVVVDGELFGTFHSIRISRVEDGSGRQVSLPISTFFPVQGMM